MELTEVVTSISFFLEKNGSGWGHVISGAQSKTALEIRHQKCWQNKHSSRSNGTSRFRQSVSTPRANHGPTLRWFVGSSPRKEQTNHLAASCEWNGFIWTIRKFSLFLILLVSWCTISDSGSYPLPSKKEKIFFLPCGILQTDVLFFASCKFILRWKMRIQIGSV